MLRGRMNRSSLTIFVSALVFALVFGTATLEAQFSAPEQISPPGLVMSKPFIEIDKTCHSCLPPYVTFSAHSDTELFFGGTLTGGNELIPIFVTPPGIGELVHKQGPLASVHMAFDLIVAPGQRGVFVTQSVASGFGTPVQYDSGFADAYNPAVTSMVDGVCLVSWVESDSIGSEVFYRIGSNPEVSLGAGERSQVARFADGSGAVLWNEAGLFRYILLDSFSQGPVLDLHNFGFTPLEWSIATLLDGTLHLVAADGTTIHHMSENLFTGVAADLGTSRQAGGAIENLSLDSVSSTSWTATWIQDQEIRLGHMESSSVTVENLGLVATEQAMSLDFAGNVHLVLRQDDGSLHYQNNIPAPEVLFTINTEDDGVAPHEIIFESLSNGMITDHFWDFGDGLTSTESSGTHVYIEPGQYFVSLTVTGPGGTSFQQATLPVSVTSPDNYMKFADISVFGGQPVFHPVLGTHTDPLQGYQIGVEFDGTFLQMNEVSIAGTQAAQLSPEFIISNIFDTGADSSLYLAVIFDTLPPFDGRTVSPGVNHTLCTLNYDVAMGLPLGSSTELRFANGIGFPPINTIYAIEGGLALEPYFIQGTILVSEQPQFLFIRGDSTYDQSVNIADAIFQLDYLFTGGPHSVCPDAADSNDDGVLNIGDAVYTLSYLFAGGETIPYPYPGYGLDPTEDSLGPCLP